MNEEEIREYIRAKNNPVSNCVGLSQYFIGRHKVLPVYLKPEFEIEFNNNPISSMNSINVDELRKTAEIFKRIPTFDDLQKENNKLLKENQQLKEQLEASEKARKEAIELINNINDWEICSKYDCIYKDDVLDVLRVLDIDKGE